MKFLVSKETRETSRTILEAIHKTPEWQRDICTLTLKVDWSSKEITHLIRTLCVEKLSNLGYDVRVVNNFQTSYTELVTNAFEYGCFKIKKEVVEIEVDVTKAYVTLRVKNSKNINFNLNSSLQYATRKLRRDPESLRGRGLLLVNSIADEFKGEEDELTVKAVFYKNYVEIESFEFQNLVVLRLRSGLFNPSCPRRIEETAIRIAANADLILDLSLWRAEITTVVVTKVLYLKRIYKEKNRKFVSIVFKSPIDVPESSIVRSWEDALALIGSPSLLPDIQSKMPKANEIVVSFI